MLQDNTRDRRVNGENTKHSFYPQKPYNPVGKPYFKHNNN